MPAAPVRSEHKQSVCLAWAGWRMTVPAAWRPLRIEGHEQSGSMTVAEGSQVRMQVKWWRPRNRRFDAQRWLCRRIKELRGTAVGRTDCPSPPGFDDVACVKTAQRRRLPDCLLWYGWSAAGRLILEVAMPCGTAGRSVRSTLFPVNSLSIRPAAEPTLWALFGGSFQTPQGFILRQHSLKLGNMSLLLDGPRRQTIVVRQVYPADLALGRRELAKWLNDAPFPRRRRYRPAAAAEPLALECDNGPLQGLIRHGRMNLAFPLAWLLRRHCVAAAVHDEQANRLLIAEHEGRQPVDTTLVCELLQGMNQPRTQRDGVR